MEKELEFFEKFVHSFDMNNEKVIYKYNHTFRVVDNAKEIAKSLNLNEKEYTRACVCALFHDLGRFPQVSEYNTYLDRLSFDHGDKSYEILKENYYSDEIVQNAVKYHNKKDLPDFDELSLMHLKIVRDADQIDIMYDCGNKPCENDVRVLDNIMNCYKNHTLVDNSAGDSEFIYTLRNLAFVFSINYKRSMEIIIEKGLISIKLNILRSETNKDQIDFIEKEIKKYIKERFDIIC